MSQKSLSQISGLLEEAEIAEIFENIKNDRYQIDFQTGEVSEAPTNFYDTLTVPKLEPVAVQEPNIVCNEDYSGDYNFDVFIDPHHGAKSPWVYSVPLRKVFITPSVNFPVEFKWDQQENMNVFVRATPAFASAQYAQDIVCRCVQHALPADPSNKDIPDHVVDHIMRCQSRSAIYLGDKASEQRLCVRVPLGIPEIGVDTVRHYYQFVCKNSCPSGMNRRTLEVVFTLEDECGQVLGRKIVNIRVCSCPKRDKDKEEMEYYNSNNKTPPYGKKRKMDNKKKSSSFEFGSTDLKEYSFTVKVVGKQNVKPAIKLIYDLMAGEAYRNGNDLPYRKVLHELAAKMNNSSSYQVSNT